MNSVLSPMSINNRYVLHERLGAGGMGVVYRATDRLNGQAVALKQLTQVVPEFVDDTARALSLTREFKTLAGLRHPHIVSVLDYGFDDLYRPFFTMHLLQDAQNILEAGRGRPLESQIDLLLQLLQALSYLHRQEIIHGDLKPDNIMVVDGRVQVLDFGLAVNSQLSHADTSGGTVAYMAPELFGNENVHNRKTDLYAVGVIAYELLTGRFPFKNETMNQLIYNVLTQPPDFDDVELDGALISVLSSLMSKDIDLRPESANAVIAGLSSAVQQSVPEETVEIRESFLQAAHFVGREKEMALLKEVLEQLSAGKGNTWLVGGESGVGKSRLLDEFRTLALVEGVTVLHGQSIEEGGRAYELWRDVFRHLMLTPGLSDLDAAVLKPYIPDMERLLGRQIPDAPTMEPEAGQNLLFRVIVDLFRAQKRPVLIILEDLHWTGTISLALLLRLHHLTSELPLLLLGNYRDDERPNLPALLPGANTLKLERLNRSDIVELSTVMLGKVEQDAELINRLQQETEGNPFFLVEVVRSLAEEAGKLSGVQSEMLPEQIFASGIQEVIKRRLAKVPVEIRPLLEIAAVAGRELDLPLLSSLARTVALDHWLSTCSQAAILEVQGQRWQFSHNKLRTGLLDSLAENERSHLHRQVAIKLEAIYGERSERLGAMVHHWAMAKETEKERHYARLAGEQASTQYANEEAVRFLSRALALTPEEDLQGRYDLLMAREKVYARLVEPDRWRADLNTLAALADKLGIVEQSTIAFRQANYAGSVSEFPQAIAFAQRAVELGQRIGDTKAVVAGYLEWASALRSLGENSEAQAEYGRALEMAQAAGEKRLIADSRRGLGLVARVKGDYDTAVQYMEQALNLYQQIGDRIKESACLITLGGINYDRGRYAAAHDFLEQGLALTRQIGNRIEEANCLVHLGLITAQQDDRARARHYFQLGIELFRQMGNRKAEAEALYNLGIISAYEGEYAEARKILERSLSLCRKHGIQKSEGNALLGLGFILYNQGNYDDARRHLEEALAISRQVGDRSGESDCLNNLGVVAADSGDYEQANYRYQQALSLAQEIDFRWQQGVTLNELGALSLLVGRPKEAAAYYEQSFAIRQEMKQTQYLVEDRAGLARVAIDEDDPDAALVQIREIFGYFEQNPRLDGTENPMRSLRFIWEVLADLGDERADEILATAVRLIEEQLAKFSEPAEREMFLARPHFAAMWRAWQSKVEREND